MKLLQITGSSLNPQQDFYPLPVREEFKQSFPQKINDKFDHCIVGTSCLSRGKCVYVFSVGQGR